MDLRQPAAENVSIVRTVGQEGSGVVTRYWVLGMIAVVVAAIFLARRMLEASDSSKRVDVPLWEDGQPGPIQIKATVEEDEDTAPAVLSPPEWTVPTSAASGPRR